jgi:hypothetical protein
VEGEDAELVVGKVPLSSFESVPFSLSCGNDLTALAVMSFSAPVLANIFEVGIVPGNAVFRVALGFDTTAGDEVPPSAVARLDTGIDLMMFFFAATDASCDDCNGICKRFGGVGASAAVGWGVKIEAFSAALGTATCSFWLVRDAGSVTVEIFVATVTVAVVVAVVSIVASFLGWA